jgi:cell division protein FtsZ
MVKDFSSSGVKVVVAGVGGGGCNTVKRLMNYGLSGASLVAINTDRIHLNTVAAPAHRVLIGANITKGLGAGGFPETALKAAESSRDLIREELKDSDIVFLCAGMGGGTGTGASPVVADIAKHEGAIVVGMVTFPFKIERARLEKAFRGLEELRKACDTLVVIDNNRLLDFVPNLPIEQAFLVADEVTARAVKGISETLLHPSMINLDFADLRTVMSGGGVSMIAVGEGKGINKVDDVVKNTLDHRLLDVDPKGARGVLLHLTGGPDMTLGDANKIGEKLTAEVDPNADVIWGARMDPTYSEKIEAIAIFTGLKEGPALFDQRAEKEWGVKSVKAEKGLSSGSDYSAPSRSIFGF